MPRIELLEADLDDLRGQGVEPDAAFRRGLDALGRRPTHDRPRERAGTPEGLEELLHLYAAEAADMRMLTFSFARRAGDYHRSGRRYDAVAGELTELRRDVVPRLRAELRELRAREAALERELTARGVDPAAIGPFVPPGTALDPTPKPGEGDEPRRRFPPLPPRRTLLDGLLRRRR